jgi:hypothetical protein
MSHVFDPSSRTEKINGFDEIFVWITFSDLDGLSRTNFSNSLIEEVSRLAEVAFFFFSFCF